MWGATRAPRRYATRANALTLFLSLSTYMFAIDNNVCVWMGAGRGWNGIDAEWFLTFLPFCSKWLLDISSRFFFVFLFRLYFSLNTNTIFLLERGKNEFNARFVVLFGTVLTDEWLPGPNCSSTPTCAVHCYQILISFVSLASSSFHFFCFCSNELVIHTRTEQKFE